MSIHTTILYFLHHFLYQNQRFARCTNEEVLLNWLPTDVELCKFFLYLGIYIFVLFITSMF